MQQTPQNAAIFLRPLAQYLTLKGLDPEPLFARHGLDVAEINVPDHRVSSDATQALLNEAQSLLDEPALGISLARHSEYSSFGGLGVALAAGGDVRAVLTRITRYHALISDAVTSELSETPQQLTITFARRGEHEPHPQAVLFVMASIVRMLRFRIDRQCNPVLVACPIAEEACTTAMARYFRCSVQHSDDFRLGFLPDVSGTRLDASDPEMAAMLEATLSERLASQSGTPLSVRLALWLESRLPEGEPSLTEAAGAFCMSGRSLQRRLKEEQLSFQKLVDNTRRALVERHLHTPGMTMTQLAFLLGFSDVSSFSRAFKRWFGVSPSRYQG
jgi:AraC-like DNA-binding protein